MNDKEVIEQYYALRSCRLVALLYGCSGETIRRLLKRNGIELIGWKRTANNTRVEKKPRTKMPKVPTEYRKTCAYCGKEFIASRKNKVYCSKRCGRIAHKIKRGEVVNADPEPYVKQCVVCGNVFETRRASVVCCSSGCTKKRRNAGTFIRPPHSEDKRCVVCGSAFIAKCSTQITCSESCRSVRKRELHDIRNKRYAEERRKENGLHEVERKCAVCGRIFSCLNSETRKTCSHECSLVYTRNVSRARARAAYKKRELLKRKCKEFDFDITLETLYKRDNGVCYLCGEVCDWSDHEWRDGNHYTGNKYPTIDHVVPLMLGGSHTWENIRLACFKCNTEKGATTPTFTKEMAREEARKFARERCTNRKKTAQYTKDGKLIRIWDSTAQIKRELGLNDKHIQSECRGYKSNTGNAYGFHWEYIVEHEDLKLKA